MPLKSLRSRGQNDFRRGSPLRADSAFLRATRAHWRHRTEFWGAEGDCASHLGLNSRTSKSWGPELGQLARFWMKDLGHVPSLMSVTKSPNSSSAR